MPRTPEQPADDEQKQRNHDQTEERKQGIHGEHYNENRNHLYDINQKIRQAVHKKPVYGRCVVVDLRHEPAGLPPGKKAEGQAFYTVEDRSLHVVDELSCNARSNDGRQHIDEYAAYVHGSDQQNHKQKLPIEAAVFI